MNLKPEVPPRKNSDDHHGRQTITIGNLNVGAESGQSRGFDQNKHEQAMAAGKAKLEEARQNIEQNRRDPNTAYFGGDTEMIGDKVFVNGNLVDPSSIPGMKVTKKGNHTTFEDGKVHHTGSLNFINMSTGSGRSFESEFEPEGEIKPQEVDERRAVRTPREVSPDQRIDNSEMERRVEEKIRRELEASFAPAAPKEKSVNVLEGGDRFVTGGVNRTDVIRGLKEIARVPVADLEENMRRSSPPFLGPRESLVDILASDNDLVLSKGLRHQDIAEALSQVVALARTAMPDTSQPALIANRGNGAPKEFAYKGDKYAFNVRKSPRMLGSPFKDYEGDVGSREIRVTNLATNASIEFNDLMEALIRKYGFYGGKDRFADVLLRVDPARIAEVFKHLKDLGEKRLAEK